MLFEFKFCGEEFFLKCYHMLTGKDTKIEICQRKELDLAFEIYILIDKE